MSEAEDSERESARTREILERRRQRLSAFPEGRTHREVVARVALLAIGSERIGVPVEHLRDIIPAPAIAALPGLPAGLVGVTQVRGELLAVADLRRLLGAPERGPARFLAILEGAAGALGCLADEVLGFRELHAGEQSAADAPGLVCASGLLSGLTSDLVGILDPGRLLADPRIKVEGSVCVS